jgi:hypothetical protein
MIFQKRPVRVAKTPVVARNQWLAPATKQNSNALKIWKCIDERKTSESLAQQRLDLRNGTKPWM